MMTNQICKRLAIQLSAVLCAGGLMLQSGMPVMAAAQVQKTKYEENGEVDVDFRTRVQYRNPKITVKDNTGKAYTAKITDRDSDELEFVIRGFTPGRKYTYRITGIRAAGEKTFGAVSGTVTIPAKTAAPKIRKVCYDAKDREVEFSLTSKVNWSKAAVTISDGTRSYTARIHQRLDTSRTIASRSPLWLYLMQ